MSGGLLGPGWAGSAADAATADPAFLQALLDAEAALTRAQAAVGSAPAQAARAVTEAADATRFDARDLALRARDGGNPVIPLVADLTTAVPAEAAPYVHRGATSQDIVDTALMLVAHRVLGPVLADLARTEQALARLAARHRDTPMPGRTLTQHAVPTTFGLKAAGWRSLVLDARDRLTAVRDALPVQLGGAAGTLAAFEAYGTSAAHRISEGHGSLEADESLEVHGSLEADECLEVSGSTVPDGGGVRGTDLLAAYARELPLAEPALPWHTLRTPVADLAAALAFTAGALGKTAADVLTLSRTEIAELSEGTGGGSSAMPHKANPVGAALIAAAARRAPLLAAILQGSLVAEDERPPGAWHAEWEPLRDLLRLVGGAAQTAAGLAEGLQVHADVMREHLDLTHGLIVSERLVAELAPVLGRARAKDVVATAARRVRAEGTPLMEALTGAPELAHEDLTHLDLAALTDPTHYTGAAGALTDRALERR
ncbi:class-II fumarase/aspartase family protein [Actinomycetota bacterium Odt1-20B]